MKYRLDALLQKKYPDLTRNQIQSFVMQGKVTVNDKIVTKSGTQISEDAEIKLSIDTPKYVSRAGFKLECVLDEFDIDVSGLVVLDAGISTGGFTDCLFQRGAKKVFGVDVGYGQVHEKIRTHKNLILMERTNLRNLRKEDLGELVDIVTLDLSFISTLKVMDAVCSVLKPEGKLLVLVKPQFEGEKHEIGKGGIVRDDKIREKIVDKVVSGIQDRGFELKGIVPSKLLGATGNQEFLAYFQRA